MDDGEKVPLATYRFDFTGRTGEYFRIWVVSLSLSVVTLGIYSAWGKVRKKRYLATYIRMPSSTAPDSSSVRRRLPF